MTSINLNENETINVELGKQSSSLNTTLNDINYIPSYKEAETERRINEVNRMVNENNREEYINDLKERVSNGEFNGKDGAIQYKAGKGIEIKNEIISTTGESGGGTWGSITGTLSDQTDLKAALDNKAETSNIPTKVSDLNNDSEFITIAVNNLTNYYKKTEIYTQKEVNALISNINSFNVEVVQILPTKNIDTHTIYLVPKETETDDNYNEYIYINNLWEHIGSTNVDLTNYYNKTEIDTKLTDINEIVISETQPAPEDAKIWIDTSEEGSGSASEVTNSLAGNETYLAPSVQAVKSIYPIGSVYTSFNTTNPSKIFGGTWEQLSNIYINNTNLIVDGLINTNGYAVSKATKLQTGKYIFSIENNGILSSSSQYQLFILNASDNEKTHFTKYIYESTRFEITDDGYSYIYVYVNTPIDNVRLSLLNNNDNNVLNCWKRIN